MVSKTADKEAPPAASSPVADEVVGASESSSQNTEASVKNSQGSEAGEANQEQEEAAAEQQEDVEMKETEDESKEGDIEMTEADAASKDVEMTPAAEVKAEDNEAKTEEDDPIAKEGAEAKEKPCAEGDVEMSDDEFAVKSGSNGAPAAEAATATEASDTSTSAELADKAAKTSPKPDTGSESSKNEESTESQVSPAKKWSPTIANEPDAVTGKEGTAESADVTTSEQVGAGVHESGDEETPSSPKRKESVQASASETSNGVSASAEPAAKKQKVDATAGKTPAQVNDVTVTDGSDDAVPSVMISRDDMAKMEEDSGRLKFEVITNDGTDEHMVQLTTLKNIFAKQLPKMPKEYIVRLVFDKNHRSMLILKNGTHVIGGICYRPFEKNHFAEIAFCAINASDQVKGYGTRLMNHLKEYVKTKNITHFLTYADNYAIGYFKKQGFTKSVSMARPNWYGYIKDYDGGTLMECTIHTQINYLRITSMIHMQRKAIQQKIKERSRSQTVYAGLTKFAEGRLMDIYMVPGVKEAGWSQAVIRNNRIGTRDQGSLKSQLSQLLKAVSSHRSAWPFHEPVDTTVVVDYLDHIKEPVDLQLISKRIDSGTYISKASFKTDLEKMCDNCMTYNTPDTNYYKAAADLREFIQSRVQIREHK